jgi:hypothetical protein
MEFSLQIESTLAHQQTDKTADFKIVAALIGHNSDNCSIIRFNYLVAARDNPKNGVILSLFHRLAGGKL